MKILLTNDDGYQAKGIRLLYTALAEQHTVKLVAPGRNRSAVSSALTLDRPLSSCITEEGFIYIEHGTPTDCVHLALTGLLDFVPDMVVSGINAGANLGDDTLYSGTVAAAMEGRFLGKPALAISAVEPFNYEKSVQVALKIINKIEQDPLPEEILLNVNVPGGSEKIRGMRVVRLGHRHKADDVIKSQDPQGRDVFWIGASGEPNDGGDGTDFDAIKKRFVSVTPLTSDLTRYSSLSRLEKWL